MKPTPKRFSFNAMGSFCEIQLCEESQSRAKKTVGLLTDEVARLESKYSRFRKDSFLSEINLAAGRSRGIEIDNETESLLEHALNCFNISDGLFDISAGALTEIWDFKNEVVPSQEQIDNALAQVGLDRLSWGNSRLRLPPGMQIDFGGIVKEYAADSVARLACSLGVRHGLVNLGGDFSVIGPLADDLSWSVAIASPDPQLGIMAKVGLRDGGLASSGDYERCFIHEGTRYSHILNPKSGWPCAGLRAVSVAANLCTVAGSVATIAMLKDEAHAKAWLEESRLPHVFMDSKELIGGSGLA